jgi:hypothetical protein
MIYGQTDRQTDRVIPIYPKTLFARYNKFIFTSIKCISTLNLYTGMNRVFGMFRFDGLKSPFTDSATAFVTIKSRLTPSALQIFTFIA